MPVPEGKITTSEIWTQSSPEETKSDELVQDELPEEERLKIAMQLHKGEL